MYDIIVFYERTNKNDKFNMPCAKSQWTRDIRFVKWSHLQWWANDNVAEGS